MDKLPVAYKFSVLFYDNDRFGLLTSEYVVENKSHIIISLLGALLFLVGWCKYLSIQGSSLFIRGMFIPIVAMMGQIFFSYILKKDLSIRKKLFPVTIMFWMIFMGVWINYLYGASYTRNKKMYFGIGFMLFLLGMIPKLNTKMGIFNPFIPMIEFSLGLLGIAGSL